MGIRLTQLLTGLKVEAELGKIECPKKLDPKSWGYEKQFEFEKNLSQKFSLSLNTNVGSKNYWPKKF